MPMHPRPSAETSSPWPNVRCSMIFLHVKLLTKPYLKALASIVAVVSRTNFLALAGGAKHRAAACSARSRRAPLFLVSSGTLWLQGVHPHQYRTSTPARMAPRHRGRRAVRSVAALVRARSHVVAGWL